MGCVVVGDDDGVRLGVDVVGLLLGQHDGDFVDGLLGEKLGVNVGKRLGLSLGCCDFGVCVGAALGILACVSVFGANSSHVLVVYCFLFFYLLHILQPKCLATLRAHKISIKYVI